MKLLLDTCVSPRTRTALAAAGHDVSWAGDWETDPGDAAILEIAKRESRILVTLDKDFGELAVGAIATVMRDRIRLRPTNAGADAAEPE